MRLSRSAIKSRALVAYYKARGVEIGRGVRIKARLDLRGPGSVVIGDGCTIEQAGRQRNAFHALNPGSRIQIGAGSYLNGAWLAAAEAISIGPNCTLSDTAVFDTDFHGVAPGARREVPAPSPVSIGENVWLGIGTTVLKGVTIGENSVVAAGCIVTHDVPPDVVIGGMGTRVLRHFDGPDCPE